MDASDSSINMIHCPQCLAACSSTAKFCPVCGSKLPTQAQGAQQPEQSPQPQPQQPPQSEQASRPQNPQQPQQPPQPQPEQSPQPQPSNPSQPTGLFYSLGKMAGTLVATLTAHPMRLAAIVIALLLVFVVLPGACSKIPFDQLIPQQSSESSQDDLEPAIPTSQVTLDVKCAENLLFSTYDIRVYVDEAYQGTIDHGGRATYDLDLTNGVHQLRIVSAQDNDVYGLVSFTVEVPGVIGVRARCYNDEVTIELTSLPYEQSDKEEQGTTSDTEPSSSDASDAADDTNTLNAADASESSSSSDADETSSAPDASSSTGDATSSGSNSDPSAGIPDATLDTEPSSSTSYEKVTAKKMVKLLESDPNKAVSTYDGAYLKVTGYVDLTSTEAGFLTLSPVKDEPYFPSITCYVISDSQLAKLGKLETGDKVTVKGHVLYVGEFLGYFMSAYAISS